VFTWLARRAKSLLFLIAVVLVALGIGHLAANPNLEPPRNRFDEILLRPSIESPEFLEVAVQLPSGEPAVHALVVMLEPELTAGFTDSKGTAQLAYFQAGDFRLQAYLPHHDLLQIGPATAADVAVLQLQERRIKNLPPLLPQTLVRFDIELQSTTGLALPNLLLRAVQSKTTTLAPWVSLADADGWARIEGVPEQELHLQAYAPGMPIDPAWLLAERTYTPRDGSDFVWKIPVAKLVIPNLAPGELLYGERVQPYAKLPLIRVPANGTAKFPVVPPGLYQFKIGDREFQMESR
jgi:hypothetical protein